MRTKSSLAAVTGILAATTAIAVPITASAAPAAGGRTYAVVKRECAAPKPGHKACFAMKLVPVAPGTAGARPMIARAPSILTGPSGFGYTPAALAGAYGYDPTQSLAKPQT